MKNVKKIISDTKIYVKDILQKESTGHDWWHVYRVWKTARYIAQQEGGDLFIIELSALLHDIADWKFHNNDCDVGVKVTKAWLEKQCVESAVIEQVCNVIKHVSFKGAEVNIPSLSLETQIVQDADRLDAMGAIGIARAFAYGGYKRRQMYDPAIKPIIHKSFESYCNNEGTTINHFYEKLLLLKDCMNTATAKRLAKMRHEYMCHFLNEFLLEWDEDHNAL